jgi:hypothetical protein
MNPKVAPPPQQPAAPPAPPAPPPKRWRFRIDQRFLAPLLITCILVVAQLHPDIKALENFPSPFLAKITFGLIDTYSPTFVAIITAILMEIILGRLFTGKWPFLTSAYISGISVGILIRSPFLWPYVVCALISIVSKYALRVRSRHIWNPTNLGVSVLLLVAPVGVGVLSVQWGNDLWPVYIIWCLGTLILWKVGRLNISITYVIGFLLLAIVRSGVIHGQVTWDTWVEEVLPITSPMYQLFIFFMITDPKTTTRSKWSQCLVAAIIAVVEMLFRLGGTKEVLTIALDVFGPNLDTKFLTKNLATYAPFYALFVVGPIANLIEIWYDARKARAVAATKA